MQRGSRNRRTWACEPAERNWAEGKYDFAASYREPKAARNFLQAAENAAVRRQERRMERQRLLTGAVLALMAVGLLAASAFVPGKRSASVNEQAALSLSALPSEEVFSESGTGRKPWCYTFLILQRDEEAENLEAAAVGMLDRKEKTLSLMTVPGELLVQTGLGEQTMEAVYADKGAYGVKNQIARLLGYPVDHYVSVSSETAAEIFELLDGGTVFLPPETERSAAWCALLEDSLARGYIRNQGAVISLLEERAYTTLTGENLRWYAGELLKLGSGRTTFYTLPTESFSEEPETLVVRKEEWLTLVNEAFCPYYGAITEENIRVLQEEIINAPSAMPGETN